MAANTFSGDWELMPKMEQIGQLTFFHLLHVDSVFSISIDWAKLKADFFVPK